MDLTRSPMTMIAAPQVVDAHAIEVKGKKYAAKHILLSVGGRATVPNIPGKEHVITSDEALNLLERPNNICIVGGGYIALEFAGIFAGLGTEVHEVHVFVCQRKVLRGFDDEIKVVLRSDIKRGTYNKVAIISGGGSGHEPAHAGYVGEGILTAAICGDVFSAPSVDAILAGIRAVTEPADCLLIVKNYTGDRLNFGSATEQAKGEGFKVEMVIVGDDCALPPPPRGPVGRRGLARTVFVHKVAGAVAAAGRPVVEVATEARRVPGLVGTMGVASSVCTLPGQNTSDRLGPRKMELGLGIHGELGAMVADLQPVDIVVSHILKQILSQVILDRIAHMLVKLQDINPIWASLGYYRRARFLLEGAKYIVQDLEGMFPGIVEELQKVPVVDGHVIRVLCKVRAISMNPKASTTVKLFWALASQLVDAVRPGDLNQALMELGASICTPKSPSCTTCPVSSQCTALKLVHRVEKKVTLVTCFPTKVPKSAPRDEYVAVCIVEREPRPKMTDSSLFLVRRPLKGLLAGLWEFPSAPLDNPDTSEKSRSIAMDKYLHDKLGVEFGGGRYSVMKREEFGTYVHVFSHICLHMFIQWVLLSVEEVEGRSTPRIQSSVVTKWVDLGSMNSLGLTSGVKKVYDLFTAFREKQLTASTSTKRRRTNVV